MLMQPTCSKRQCKHFWGVLQDGEKEETERNHCAAFPNRIPDEIAYGSNKHAKPLPDQGNDIVYEKK